jgi:hypothetical protein
MSRIGGGRSHIAAGREQETTGAAQTDATGANRRTYRTFVTMSRLEESHSTRVYCRRRMAVSVILMK